MDLPKPNDFRKTKPASPETMKALALPETVVGLADVSLILRKTLSKVHITDPNVMNFISKYLLCRDIKQAANQSGFTKSQGENLRRRPDIHEAITQITEAALFKHGYDAAEIIERMKEVVFIDPAELQNPDGSFKETLSEMPPEARRAIKGFKAKNIYDLDPNGMKVVVGKLIEVQFWDKLKAAEMLGQEKDVFVGKKTVKHDIGENMSKVLLASKERAEAEASKFRDVTATELIAASEEGET